MGLNKKIMNQKKLIEKLLLASKYISENRKGNGDCIHLDIEFIQRMANSEGISFDEMVKRIQNDLKP